MNTIFLAIIFSSLFLAFLFFLEFITRKKNYKKELTRRIVHLSSGLFAIAMAYLLTREVFIFFVIIFLVIITASYAIKFFSSIHNVQRKTYGELFFPIGILLAYLLGQGPSNEFLAATLVLSISDPLAGVTGEIQQTKKYKNLRFYVFFISAFTILLCIFPHVFLLTIAVIAACLTLIEAFTSYGLDNLAIPVSAILLFMLFL